MPLKQLKLYGVALVLGDSVNARSAKRKGWSKGKRRTGSWSSRVLVRHYSLNISNISNQRQDALELWGQFQQFSLAHYYSYFAKMWVCLKMLCTPKPNGFADHYPYEKWLFHWEYTQHFQTNPCVVDGFCWFRFSLVDFCSSPLKGAAGSGALGVGEHSSIGYHDRCHKCQWYHHFGIFWVAVSMAEQQQGVQNAPKRHEFLGPKRQEGLMQTSSLAEMNLLQLGGKVGSPGCFKNTWGTQLNTTIKGIGTVQDLVISQYGWYPRWSYSNMIFQLNQPYLIFLCSKSWITTDHWMISL